MSTLDGMSEVVRLAGLALDVPPEHRPAWLQRHCSDPSIRAAVAQFLQDDDGIKRTFGPDPFGLGPMLDRPAATTDASTPGPRAWIGDVLPGPHGQPKWEILDVVSGGFSHVYVVADRQDAAGGLLAAKTFPGSIFSDKTGRLELVVLEAGIWARIPWHPNIVPLLEVRAIGGKFYLFMPFYPQGDLAGAIAHGRLAHRTPLCLYYAMQICDGLEHAYQHGVGAHRDIKPANCFLQGEAYLAVADMGISRPAWPSLAVVDLAHGFGTPAYAAPEQLAGEVADKRSDVYSTGATIFEMLTGTEFFKNQERVVSGEARSHRSSLRLNDIVRRCLQPDPGKRFTSAGELRGELADAFEELTGHSAPPRTGPLFRADDPRTLFHQADQLSKLGEHAEAEALYRRVLKDHPKHFAARQGLADELWQQKRFEEARREAQLAIELSDREARP